MNNADNIHITVIPSNPAYTEIELKYFKLQEQRTKAQRKYYEKNRDELIRRNRERIVRIKDTKEFQAQKAAWNHTSIAKTNAMREAARQAEKEK